MALRSTAFVLCAASLLLWPSPTSHTASHELSALRVISVLILSCSEFPVNVGGTAVATLWLLVFGVPALMAVSTPCSFGMIWDLPSCIRSLSIHAAAFYTVGRTGARSHLLPCALRASRIERTLALPENTRLCQQHLPDHLYDAYGRSSSYGLYLRLAARTDYESPRLRGTPLLATLSPRFDTERCRPRQWSGYPPEMGNWRGRHISAD